MPSSPWVSTRWPSSMTSMFCRTLTEPPMLKGQWTRTLDHARIQVNQGKTEVWRRSGVRPNRLRPSVLQATRSTQRRMAGITILGTPFGHPAFVEAQLFLQSTQLFSRGSLRCKICSVCVALALVLRRRIESKLPPSRYSPSTEFPLRGASRRQRVPRTVVAQSCNRRSVANGQFLLEAWVCGTPRDCVSRHTGPVGRVPL